MSNEPEPPKKPMNAYFLYLNKVKDDVVKKNPNLSYKEQVAKIGEMYKNLSDKEREPYENEAQKLKDKYEQERTKYEAKYGKIQKVQKGKMESITNLNKAQKQQIEDLQKQIKDLQLPEKPKKALSAFFLYKAKVQDQIAAKNPDLKITDIVSKVSEQYKNISQSEKDKLDKEANMLKEKADKEKDIYENKYREKLNQEKLLKKRIQEIEKNHSSGKNVNSESNEENRKKGKKEKSAKKTTTSSDL